MEALPEDGGEESNGELGKAASKFEKAYNLMMKIVGDLEDNYNEGKKEEK